MKKVIYIIEIKNLEKLFVEKGIKQNYGYQYSEIQTANRFCKNFCSDYDVDYEKDSIVIYIENNYVSYSDLEYLDENYGEYEGYKMFDLRNIKKSNSIFY